MVIIMSVIGVLLFIIIAFMFFLIMLILVKIDNNMVDDINKERHLLIETLKNHNKSNERKKEVLL